MTTTTGILDRLHDEWLAKSIPPSKILQPPPAQIQHKWLQSMSRTQPAPTLGTQHADADVNTYKNKF